MTALLWSKECGRETIIDVSMHKKIKVILFHCFYYKKKGQGSDKILALSLLALICESFKFLETRFPPP